MIELYERKYGVVVARPAQLKDLYSLWDRAITQFKISPEKEPEGTDLIVAADGAALDILFKAMIATDVIVLSLPEKLVDAAARGLRDFVGRCIVGIDDATLEDQMIAAALYLPILDPIGLVLDSAAIAFHLHGTVDKLGEPGNPTSVASVLTSEGVTVVANEPSLAFDPKRKIDESVGELVAVSMKRAQQDLKLEKYLPPSEGAYRAYDYYVKMVKTWSKQLANPNVNAKFGFGELAEHYLKLGKTKQIHAELRLIDLFVAGGLTAPPLGLLYIGSSLLCCSDCTRAIEFFNNHVAREEGLGLRVLTRGSHAGCYKDSWDFPYFVAKYKDAFLEANPGFVTRAANAEAARFSRTA